ncbi:hypothetical protein ACIRP2_23705 [Streptomyces sp. NPDC101194]|uniref:hypothetical protein n=1 Tax=Streptomyces sp. NPDC101194 TaxID=3366127 RepID=UPI0037FA9E64
MREEVTGRVPPGAGAAAGTAVGATAGATRAARVPDSLDARLRDEIDDQVAEAFDAYLSDRLAEPGPLRASLTAGRGARVVLGTIALGALATALAPPGVAAVCGIWGAIAVIDVTWLWAARRR